MRSLICRFKDEAEFVAHLDNNHSVSFLAELDLGLGDEIELAVFVANCRQRARFCSVVIERVTMGIDVGDAGTRTVWSYRAQIAKTDRVWLDEFRSRVSTARRVRFAA